MHFFIGCRTTQQDPSTEIVTPPLADGIAATDTQNREYQRYAPNVAHAIFDVRREYQRYAPSVVHAIFDVRIRMACRQMKTSESEYKHKNEYMRVQAQERKATRVINRAGPTCVHLVLLGSRAMRAITRSIINRHV